MDMTYKRFSRGEIKRRQEQMTDQQKRDLTERLDQLIQDRDDVTEEWTDGYISYDAAVEQSQMIGDEIKEIILLLQ